MTRAPIRSLFVLAFALSEPLSPARAEQTVKAIHDVRYMYQRLELIESFCSKRKFTNWTPEDEGTQLEVAQAVSKWNPMSPTEHEQLLREILNGNEYNVATSYYQYLEIPTPPMERGPQGVRFKMTDSEWKADKEAKRKELVEWCASADKKFRKIMDDYVKLGVVPSAPR